MSYIDGFVIPVPNGNREAYVALAKTMAAIFIEYGAVRVVEGWGDDIKPGKINDFRTAVIAGDSETVVFCWTEWPSKPVRDIAHERIMADPRVPAGDEMPFDAKRMILGGVIPVVDTTGRGNTRSWRHERAASRPATREAPCSRPSAHTKQENEMSKIAPCLWFNGEAEEAARFYVSLFADSAVGAIARFGKDAPFPAGVALMVEFTLAGQRFQALNGGPQFRFSEAVSFSISCRDAAELDRAWTGLTADGGEAGRCGWLKDRFGVSWQVVPDGLGALMSDPDPVRAGRAAKAVMGMAKLDIAAIRAAVQGEDR